jgi:hypothetical protein
MEKLRGAIRAADNGLKDREERITPFILDDYLS